MSNGTRAELLFQKVHPSTTAPQNHNHHHQKMASSSEVWIQWFTCCLSQQTRAAAGSRAANTKRNGSAQQQQQQRNGQSRLRIDRSMIGAPTNFQHTGHIGSGDLDMASAHLTAIQTQMQGKGGYETSFGVKAC